MNKAQKKEARENLYRAMSHPQLKEELCKTLVGTLMPLIEKVVAKRVSQWIDCIEEGIEETIR